PDARSRGYHRLAYPRPYPGLVDAAARESGIETSLIWGVMRQESAFVAGIESRANAIGLMQLILPTAKAMAKRLDLEATPQTLRRPEVNIRLGAKYLSGLIRRFEQPLLAIPGYNAGGGAVAKGLAANPGLPVDEFVETIGAEETRNYARKVFESYANYRFLYGRGPDRFSRVRFAR
ncbi:MAG TPA: lytic transglycosylase domain-containing protein, partial [Myxococcota bacterium]|nr:lytic transglycosylase domain-containing protein [Myxococcota bacterium]